MRIRIAVVALIAGLAALVYFRPLAVYFAARRVYLAAIGIRGRDVHVGAHRIHYLEGGEGPPLVLVHGVAMRAADWAPLLRTLTHSHHVYAPDLLGYGDSDQPRDGDYSIATQAAVVRGFLDAVHLQQPDVAGVSMGGWVALKLANDHPERVRRLVLISSAGLSFETKLKESSFSATNLDEQQRSFALQTDRHVPDFIARDFLRYSRDKAWVVRASMRSMLQRRDLLLDGRLQRVGMPVLLIAGTSDRIVPFAVALRLRRQLPQARLVTLRGCGHLAVIECREDTLRAMEAFLHER